MHRQNALSTGWMVCDSSRLSGKALFHSQQSSLSQCSLNDVQLRCYFYQIFSHDKSWLYFFFDLKQIRGKWITCFRKRNGYVHSPIRLLITPLLHMGVASALYQPVQRWSSTIIFGRSASICSCQNNNESRNTVVGTSFVIVYRRLIRVDLTKCWELRTFSYFFLYNSYFLV